MHDVIHELQAELILVLGDAARPMPYQHLAQRTLATFQRMYGSFLSQAPALPQTPAAVQTFIHDKIFTPLRRKESIVD